MNSILCSICQDIFSSLENSHKVVTSCGHIYHSSCLQRWLHNSLRLIDSTFIIALKEQWHFFHTFLVWKRLETGIVLSTWNKIKQNYFSSLTCPDCRSFVLSAEIRRIYFHFSKCGSSDAPETSLNEALAKKTHEIKEISKKYEKFQQTVRTHLHTINTEMRSIQQRVMKFRQTTIQKLEQNERQRSTLIMENAELKKQIELDTRTLRKMEQKLSKRLRINQHLQSKIRKLKHFRRCQVSKPCKGNQLGSE